MTIVWGSWNWPFWLWAQLLSLACVLCSDGFETRLLWLARLGRSFRLAVPNWGNNGFNFKYLLHWNFENKIDKLNKFFWIKDLWISENNELTFSKASGFGLCWKQAVRIVRCFSVRTVLPRLDLPLAGPRPPPRPDADGFFELSEEGEGG